MAITIEKQGPVTIISIARPEVRNCVNRETQFELAAAWEDFDQDENTLVGVFCGEETGFCAGADLKGVSQGEASANVCKPDGPGPMGPSRMLLSKPVIGAISGHAVAGGLELALWCDMRIAEEDTVMGVYCRRWGIPLIDGGTIRLPRIIGQGRALDLILTGRGVKADEALAMGLVNRIVPKGEARTEAIKLAMGLAQFPQICMRSDRMSSYEQWDLSLNDAIKNEFQHGLKALNTESLKGATRFADGHGREGNFDDISPIPG